MACLLCGAVCATPSSGASAGVQLGGVLRHAAAAGARLWHSPERFFGMCSTSRFGPLKEQPHPFGAVCATLSSDASAQVSRRAACQYMLRQLEPLVTQVRSRDCRLHLRPPLSCKLACTLPDIFECVCGLRGHAGALQLVADRLSIQPRTLLRVMCDPSLCFS